MAIDTASKRASALGVAFVPNLFIIPDGAIGQGDRQTLCHMYSGILAGIALKWVTQSPDNTSYTIQAPDSTSYAIQTPDATIWTTIPEDQ